MLNPPEVRFNSLTLRNYKLLNLLCFKLLWVILVIFQNKAAIPAIFILIMLSVCHPERKEAWKSFLLISLSGIGLDSALSMSGLFIFNKNFDLMPIPLWLLLLWFAFAMTLPYGFAFIVKSSVLIQALTGAAASFSYLIGMKLDAVEYGYSVLLTQSILLVLWAVLIPVYFHLIQKEWYSVLSE